MILNPIETLLLPFALLLVLSGDAICQNDPAVIAEPDLVAKLTSDDVQAIRDAAVAVSKADASVQVRALPRMIELLGNEKDVQILLAIFDTARRLGPKTASIAPALAKVMQTDYGIRHDEELHLDYRAALAQASIGRAAVGGLKSLLDSDQANVREKAAMALGRIGGDSSPAIDNLTALLADEDDDVWRAAALALAQVGSEAREALVRAAHHTDSRLRAAAVRGLGQSGLAGRRETEVVVSLAKDHDPLVRAAALRALANMAPDAPKLRELLQHGLVDQADVVQVAVVNVLAGSHKQLLGEFEDQLIANLTSEHDSVARHSSFLLQAMGVESIPHLLEALKHERSRPEQIGKAIAMIGPRAARTLLEATTDQNPRVRRGAVLALGHVRPMADGTADALMDALDNSDRELQRAALTSIGKLGRATNACVESIRALQTDDSADIRCLVIEILLKAAPRDKQLAKDFARMIADPDRSVQLAAIVGTRKLGLLGRTALPAVIGQLKNPALDIRVAAIELIGQHRGAAIDAVPSLIEILSDASPQLRGLSAQALAQFGEYAKPAFSQLSILSTDQEASVRAAAIQAITGLGVPGSQLRELLVGALRDEDQNVRRQAFGGLRRLGSSANVLIPDLILLAGDEEQGRFPKRSLQKFEQYGTDPQSVPELIDMLSHENETVRSLSVRFLGFARESASISLPQLESLLENSNDALRQEAADAIARIQGKEPIEADGN